MLLLKKRNLNEKTHSSYMKNLEVAYIPLFFLQVLSFLKNVNPNIIAIIPTININPNQNIRKEKPMER